jgi:hypothetical protein
MVHQNKNAFESEDPDAFLFYNKNQGEIEARKRKTPFLSYKIPKILKIQTQKNGRNKGRS